MKFVSSFSIMLLLAISNNNAEQLELLDFLKSVH